jgi:hypothetical protein
MLTLPRRRAQAQQRTAAAIDHAEDTMAEVAAAAAAVRNLAETAEWVLIFATAAVFFFVWQSLGD